MSNLYALFSTWELFLKVNILNMSIYLADVYWALNCIPGKHLERVFLFVCLFGMRDPSSPNRDLSHARCSESGILTTGRPGKSQEDSFLIGDLLFPVEALLLEWSEPPAIYECNIKLSIFKFTVQQHLCCATRTFSSSQTNSVPIKQ